MYSNGNPEPGAFRADIQMRIVIDTPTYAEIGGLMDEISAMVYALFMRDKLRAEFDFTSFNTHPCKTVRMDRMVYPDPGIEGYPSHPAEQIELTQH